MQKLFTRPDLNNPESNKQYLESTETADIYIEVGMLPFMFAVSLVLSESAEDDAVFVISGNSFNIPQDIYESLEAFHADTNASRCAEIADEYRKSHDTTVDDPSKRDAHMRKYLTPTHFMHPDFDESKHEAPGIPEMLSAMLGVEPPSPDMLDTLDILPELN